MYASSLPRAIETANIVRDAFPHIDNVRTSAELCELVPGECDGMPYEEAIARYAPEEDSADVAMSPGGESTREFDARVRRALDQLVETHQNESVVVVTHGGFIAAACMYALGAPGLGDVYPFRLWPANVSLTTFVAETKTPPWLLEHYNDTAHVTAPTTKAW
jgi:broad specificity phosphatase PhoE